MDDMQALEAKKLEKSYRGRKIVRGISLQVSHGEVVGLLGPNGAGKTTTFYMVVGLVRPDKGRVASGRCGYHKNADVSAGEERHRLFAPGTVGLPKTDRS